MEVERLQVGSCRCGGVAFEIAGEPLITMACHCVGCQRMTASAFSLSAMYPAERFTVTAGAPVLGGLRGETRHYFCDSCKSWLYTSPEGAREYVNVRATMCDNAQTFQPFMECYTKEKLAWVNIPCAYSFEGFPDRADYAVMIPEFASR